MKGGATKSDEFSEKLQEGGVGVIFNPKIYIVDFCHYRLYFGLNSKSAMYAVKLELNDFLGKC